MNNQQKARAQPSRILVVDDDPAVRALLADFLRQQGYEVRTTSNGPAALTTLRVEPCDALLVDLQMPGMSGLELATMVRKTAPQVPIALLTGHP